MTKTAPAAYGLRLTGLKSSRWLAVSGADHWPKVASTRDRRHESQELVFDTRVLELRVRADIDHDVLVHPLLGRIGAHLALSRGGDAMHAGAVAGARGAWGVIGPKGAGKSSLLAALANVGTPIVTDDVLVFASGTVMAGPRCIDLRPDVGLLGPGVDVRPNDPRRRVTLPPIAAEHSLAGFIHLEWSAGESALEPIHHRDAINRLVQLQSEKGYPADPRNVLDLAALPNVRLSRPRSWSALNDTVALVRRLVHEH